jgi:hypothetical protein
MGLTEEAAQYYLSVLTSHSLELSEKLKTNDAEAAVDELAKQRQKELGKLDKDGNTTKEGGVVGQDELKTIAVAYDMNEDDLKKMLEDEYGIVVVGSFKDDKGNPLTGDSLRKALEADADGI